MQFCKLKFNKKAKFKLDEIDHQILDLLIDNTRTAFTDIAKKLLSTNNEKWNTIPRTYAEIDTLRAKFEKENHQDKLAILDEINAYVEELEKTYSKVYLTLKKK